MPADRLVRSLRHTAYALRMTMMSFRVDDHEAAEAQRWADELGVDKSELLREALHRHQGARVAGELVGISKISGPLFDAMVRIAEKAFETSLQYDYETDCLVAAAAERDIACPVSADLAWAEIDDPAHLRRARDTVYPEILRRSR